MPYLPLWVPKGGEHFNIFNLTLSASGHFSVLFSCRSKPATFCGCVYLWLLWRVGYANTQVASYSKKRVSWKYTSAVFLLSRGWKFTSFSFRLWKQNNNCLLIQLRVSVLVLVRSRCRKNTGILHQAILTINVVYFYYLLCIGTIVSSFFFHMCSIRTVQHTLFWVSLKLLLHHRFVIF